MEMHERIKELRKNYLKMSQTEFGTRLGVSRSVIKNIELNVLARPEQKLSLYKLICSEFHVNEEWLLNGTGEIFSRNETEYSALIDQIMTGENEFAKNVFKTFAAFDEDDWKALYAMIKKYTIISNNSPDGIPEGNRLTDPKHDLFDGVPDTPEELEKRFPPVDPDDKHAAG